MMRTMNSNGACACVAVAIATMAGRLRRGVSDPGVADGTAI
jgi:hypothetical protein